MEKASEMAREAPKHMKWEPTHFTGLSLKLKLRLPCLRKFRFVFCPRGQQERRKKKERDRESEREESGRATVQVYCEKWWDFKKNRR